MHNYWWCAILFRIFLPCVIAIAAFLRPTITSYVYMILGCYLPFFSVPTSKSIKGNTGNYVKLLMTISTLTCSLVLSFYFVLFFPAEPKYNLEPCSFLEKLIRTLGIVQYDELNFNDAITWCLPEPLMLATSLTLYLAFKRLSRSPEIVEDLRETEKDVLARRKRQVDFVLGFGKYLLCFMLCVAAVLKATIFGAIYYIVFLAILTYWSCNQSLGKVFARILICLVPVIYINITVMFLYQFQYFQDNKAFDNTNIWGRVFGLVKLKTYKDCSDPKIFKIHYQPKATYVLPFGLFFLHHVTVLVARQILDAKDGIINLMIVFLRCKGNRASSERWSNVLKKLQKQIEEEKLVNVSSIKILDKCKITVNQTAEFVVGISYLITNFIMMVWAIAFIGWKSFILLIWANLIWLLPYRKKVMLTTSPFLVAYVHFLLLTTYLYSMDLTEEELPKRGTSINWASGVYMTGSQKWAEIFTKSLFAVIICVTMRQLWQERAVHKQNMEIANTLNSELSEPKTDSSFVAGFQKACLGFFAIWWIWIVIIAMVWMEFWSTSNLFRIAFIGLAVIFLLTFQLCPFVHWKKFLWIYWWIVITYAMFNLLAVYMYQLKETRDFLYMYISEKTFQRFGFRIWHNAVKRFLALANPIFFQIAIVIQQNYLQEEFNKRTSPIIAPEDLSKLEDLASRRSKWSTAVSIFNASGDVLFAILEIHLPHLILLAGWFMCFFDICAIFAPFVVLFTMACVLGGKFSKIIIHAISCLVQILIIAKLTYMNQHRRHENWNYVGYYTRNGEPYNVTLNTADWLGFHQSSYGQDYADFWQLIWCFGYVFLVILNRIVKIRMKNHREAKNLQLSPDGIMFPGITCQNCHDSTKNMLKFLSNYGFYKFGCEISMIYASIVMGLRMDAVSISISFWLLIMFALNRTWMKRLWVFGLVLLALVIPLQYLSTLGWWPPFFERSLTGFWNSNDYRVRLQQFFYLMNMAHPPLKAKISLDFLLLLIMSRQWQAFQREPTFEEQNSNAGSNQDVSHLMDNVDVKNPVPDFITYTRTNLDIYMRILFTVWFYMSLMAVFLAGAMRPGLYSAGYILGAFWFLWEGSHLFLRPARTILLRWNLLIAYTILVMMLRLVSQIFGCILIYEKPNKFDCRLFRLFTVGCVDKYGMTEGIPNLDTTSSCDVNYEALGLGWDCFCFFCLIFQQRLFKSFYFFHMVDDAKAYTILADRGAELIEAYRRKTRQAIDNEVIAIQSNIKRKMERIRANDKKIKTIRAGYYHLFNEVEKDTDIPLLPLKKHEDSEYDPYDPMPLTEYMGLFVATNITNVLESRAKRNSRKKAFIKKVSSKPSNKAIDKPGTSKTSDTVANLALPTTRNVPLFLWGLFESLVVSLTGIINHWTRNFRSILNKIHEERKILQEKTNYSQGVRLGLHKVWHPVQSYKDILNAQQEAVMDEDVLKYSIYIKLLRSTWYLIIAYSEWLCYIAIILNQTLKNNFLSLPLVILTFCWGVLTVPKPTKTFWIVSIAYILILVFLKNFFKMGIAPWDVDSYRENVFFPPTLIGLHNQKIYLNLAMLFAYFFHRLVLQRLGLWKTYKYRNDLLIEDGDYSLKGGKIVPLANDDRKSQQILTAMTVEVPMGEYFPKSVPHGFSKYAEKFGLYFQQLIFPSAVQIPVDVYTPMFLCDLINMFILMFFYGSFQERTDLGLIGFVRKNRVPASFIVVVLVHFVLMIIDRWLYLRKNRFGKLIFHFIQVIGYHVLFFILSPILTHRQFRDNPAVQSFYVFKCLYFLFSAYQIRSGYPTLISFHYLWHDYTLFHRFGYKLYRIIPYFLEIRCLLDWICSDSCLGIPSWFKLEDITQSLFDQKCRQEYENKWSQPSGQRRNRAMKLLVGIFLYLILILTLIFPLLLYSLSSSMGVTTRPRKIKLELYMGSAQPIFEAYAPESDLIEISQEDYKNLSRTFNNIQASDKVFENFEAEDVLVVKWSAHSLTTWEISPGNREELIEELESNEHFAFRLEIQYTHIGHGGQKLHRVFGQSTNIPPLPNAHRQNLIDMVKSKNQLNNTVWLPLVFPKFLMISSDANAKSVSLMENPGDFAVYEDDTFAEDEDDDENIPPDPKRLRNLLIKLRTVKKQAWWQVNEECTIEDDNYLYYLKDLVHNSCDELVLYVFNEKVFSHVMQYMIQGGILGLYLLYFMLVIETIRDFRVGIKEMWLEDLPNSDKVFRKCMEIYVARDMKNYELEREIFEELICIMRSPELLIKLTRFQDNNNYNPTFITPETAKKED